MKRVGITQRVSTSFHGRAHDCLDQSWSDICAAVGVEITPLPNLEIEGERIRSFLSSLNLSGLILSGGNDIHGLGEVRGSQSSARRDKFETEAVEWARAARIPLLGVCRGMQFLNHILGGTLVAITGHAGSRHKIHMVNDRLPDWFEVYPAHGVVNSYHTFAVAKEKLAEGLRPAAFDDEGWVEAFYHVNERVAGVMWHPERESPFVSFDTSFLSEFFRI